MGHREGLVHLYADAIDQLYGTNDIVEISRSTDGLDITNEESIKNVLSGLDGEFDLIFVTTGALEINGIGPEKNYFTNDAREPSCAF